MYKYLFGPVPSRRLGISLGVDLVPKKVCSLDCVYCEVGKTTKLTIDRKEYIRYEKITEELSHYFSNNPDPDYITFSGSGEPLLNSRLGDVLNFIKRAKPAIPVAVLTNGTLLFEKDVRDELMNADVVLPSLDAVVSESFIRINRPAAGLDIEKIIKGLIAFRKEFPGKIWLEVFILPDYNNSEKDLFELKDIIKKINPDSVQLNTLDRPGVVAGLKPAGRDELQQLAEAWALPNIEIISSAGSRKNIESFRSDVESAILGTISRRPCTGEDLVQVLGLHINEINKYLDVLESDGKIEAVEQERGVFYITKASESGKR